ncbi:BQ2448_2086 [Microbotryum intermedium]|uniref:BQ2448_2086 protein n=1 Tax=Microbotryum intermedium TaxID=269621 RepID=A0A238FD97_9BASI|nr:BQ2448_2086 [Microbotryum intermedium]
MHSHEYAELQADWPPYVVAQPDEANLLHWVSHPSTSSDRPGSPWGICGCPTVVVWARFPTGTITGPPDSAYKGGNFKIDITFPIEYPFKSPNIKFASSSRTTRIYHPNVTDDGALCVGVLKAEAWKPSTKIDQVLRALVQLLQEPNPDDALVAAIAEQYNKERLAFNKTAQEWVKKVRQWSSSHHAPSDFES